jgi:hypothetical protein
MRIIPVRPDGVFRREKRGNQEMNSPEKQKTAALLLGCPQVPVQTGIALYLISALRKRGVMPTVAGNRAARLLVEVSDPDRHYVGEVMDIDRCVGELAEKKRDFDYIFAFIHNDAGVTYAATVQALSKGAMVVLVYGEHYDQVAAEIEFPCEKIMAKAVHNPMPLKKKIDEVLNWVVSNL